jgi:uncharacterized protein
MIDNPRNDWFITYSGVQFYPWRPSPEMIHIEDIAHHLSNICRFGGASHQFYSVAQHSILVTELLPADLQFVGLMHDATEAYCGDMVRPLKRAMNAYRELESGLWTVIAEKFGLPLELPEQIKVADNIALVTERREFITPNPDARPWKVDESGVQPAGIKLRALYPFEAEPLFLERFKVLRGANGGT